MTNSRPLSPKASTLRIMIVDDHPIALEGLAAILNASSDFNLVGAARSGEEAIERFAEFHPDVTIMDLRLGALDGIETIRRIRTSHPGSHFVVMTTFDGDENVYRAIEAGASAYLLKDSLRQELFSAIHAASQGRRHVSASVAAQLAQNLPRVDLTPREREVLELMASGMRNKEIAAALGIAEFTARVHVQNILGKMRVNDRTEAVVIGFKRGFLHLT
ncbi:MAG: response regulator transcription factor [Bryobacteraceae bacterium]|nr:response regulator transcription factor [Bryobacteraceae bacterium]